MSRFNEEVAGRFGVLPNFFCSALAAPGLIEELWGFTKSAYLDSPLPSLLKERLFVHLSRFCVVRYCIVRHVGFLIGQGRPAGDAGAQAETVAQALALLRRPTPDAEALERVCERLLACEPPGRLPTPEQPLEGDLFDALTVIFLTPTQSAWAREAVRHAVGDRDFERLNAFLAFVRTAHYWTQTHPELAYEPDMQACLAQHPELASLLLNAHEAEAADVTAISDRLATTEAALRQQEGWLAAQKEAFQASMNEASLEASLGVLIHAAIAQFGDGRRCAFYVAGDARGESLRHVVGMPDSFAEAVDGLTISLESLNCGLALATGQPVITPDVREDPLWRDWLSLAHEHGYRGCWSFPVETAAGKLVGSLAMYFAEPRSAEPSDFEAAAAMTQTAAIIISRHQGSEERDRAEAALRDSEDRLRTVLAGINEPFYVLDRDWAFLFASQSALQLWGKTADAVLGRSFLEVFPQVAGSEAYEAHRRVMQTGASERLQTISAVIDGWVEIDFAATPQGGLSVAFRDIEARKQMERRQAFLLKLSDALRPLANSADMERTAMRILAEALRVDRAFFATIDADGEFWSIRHEHAEDVPTAPGRYPISMFQRRWMPHWQAGRMSSIADSQTDPAFTPEDRAAYAAFGTRAAIRVPLMTGGRLAALLSVNQASPRTWTKAELALTLEAAERIWAAIERARAEEALHESEEKFAALFAASPVPFMALAPNAPDFTITAANEAYLAATLTTREGLVGRRLFDVFTDDPARLGERGPDALQASLDRVLTSKQPDMMARMRLDIVNRNGGFEPRWWLAINAPVLDSSGDVIAIIHQVTNETSLYFAQVAEQDNQRRQSFLLGLSDTLRPISEPSKIKTEAMRVLGGHLRVNRAQYYEADQTGEYFDAVEGYADGLSLITGRSRIDDLGPGAGDSFNGGQTVAVSDVSSDPRVSQAKLALYAELGIRAFLGIPLVKGGRWVGAIALHHATAHDWTSAEVALAEDVADRTWAAVERARVESTLRESEERLRTLADMAPALIWFYDSAGNNIFVNQVFVDYTGRAAKEIAGDGWQGLVDPGHGDQYIAGYHKAVLDKRPWQGRTRIRRADGVWHWFENYAQPLFAEDRRHLGHVGVSVDVNDVVVAEQALRESEERLRQFGEASQDVLWIRDAETLDWTYLTPAFETIYGLDREQALAGDNYRNWQDLILPEDRAHAAENIQRVGRGEQVVFEYRIRRPLDGKVCWLRDTDFPIRNAEGQVKYIGGVGHDVTAMKEAEEALAAAEQRQRLLLEGIPQLVWRAVGAGHWTWASPQWSARTGLNDEASRGRGWLNALHPEDRDAALAAWDRAEIDGIYQVDYRVRHGESGDYHWFQSRGTSIRRGDGGIVEWLGSSTDIDDQVRARELLTRTGEELERRVTERTVELQQALDTLHQETGEREQAEERLRQSEKLKAVGQLTGGIAHDFNNMLQGITSALALVRTRLAQSRYTDAAAYIEPAMKAANRAGALTHRLLAFSRQQTLAPVPVNMDQISQGMEDMVRRTVGPAVQVEFKSANGHWLVLCDPNQMESALLNLCVNARDAMPDGGWLTISTEERMLPADELVDFEDLQPGRYAVLAVTDTGAGMPPGVVARVFEPFYTTKPQGQGTGLGLSQIYGFMRQSGGLVQIETAAGKGTTVRLCLPFYEMNTGEQFGPPTNGKTLLLVEDEHDVRGMLADQLRDLGYRVLEADTAAAAVRVLSTGVNVDLLVTDVGLRGGTNGRQLADTARERTSSLPVIFITGFAMGETLSGEDVVRKPFETAALAHLIKERLSAKAGG